MEEFRIILNLIIKDIVKEKGKILSAKIVIESERINYVKLYLVLKYVNNMHSVITQSVITQSVIYRRLNFPVMNTIKRVNNYYKFTEISLLDLFNEYNYKSYFYRNKLKVRVSNNIHKVISILIFY
jgi:hypothetical protein